MPAEPEYRDERPKKRHVGQYIIIGLICAAIIAIAVILVLMQQAPAEQPAPETSETFYEHIISAKV